MPTPSSHGEGILVVGNPAFDQKGNTASAANQQPAANAGTAVLPATIMRGSRSACGTFQTLRFPLLPASQQEVENIAVLWKRSMSQAHAGRVNDPLELTGEGATREAFLQYAPGKRVLHVATHGFFMEGSCQSVLERQSNTLKRDSPFLHATAENPLLLSGLALAGVNRRDPKQSTEDDGILTAEEIASVNLEGVDWAVLSACETGIGAIKAGEGVFGLRRAFQVAGAKTVIMSLWRIEDETTRQWMTALYRNHFLNQEGTGESVRDASLQILRQRQARHQSTHPFYWGAFIAAGDWH
jgi:CHAT domain-containing protein